MDAETSSDLKMMKREIDTLQVEIMKGHIPWYKSPPILIAFLALLFSFGTTLVSFQRISREDIRLTRAELRGILQRLVKIPKEEFELRRKYPDDFAAEQLTGYYLQETSLIVRQAAEILDRIPDYITAQEYYSVAAALLKASDTGKVSYYMECALAKVSDPNTKVAILRSYADHLLVTGLTIEGRRRYEQALDVWRDYPNLTDYHRVATNAYTEMGWSDSEAFINNIEEAKIHIRKAFELANTLPTGPVTAQLLGQILNTQELIEQRFRDDVQTLPSPSFEKTNDVPIIPAGRGPPPTDRDYPSGRAENQLGIVSAA